MEEFRNRVMANANNPFAKQTCKEYFRVRGLLLLLYQCKSCVLPVATGQNSQSRRNVPQTLNHLVGLEESHCCGACRSRAEKDVSGCGGQDEVQRHAATSVRTCLIRALYDYTPTLWIFKLNWIFKNEYKTIWALTQGQILCQKHRLIRALGFSHWLLDH